MFRVMGLGFATLSVMLLLLRCFFSMKGIQQPRGYLKVWQAIVLEVALLVIASFLVMAR